MSKKNHKDRRGDGGDPVAGVGLAASNTAGATAAQSQASIAREDHHAQLHLLQVIERGGSGDRAMVQ